MKVLVVGASPDRINRNAALRGHVALGFEELLSPQDVKNCAFKHGPEAIATFQPDLILVFGSCMPDQCDYAGIKRAALSARAHLSYWLHDDPYEFDYNFKATETADTIFTNDRWALEHYRFPRIFHLPMAACKRTHYRELGKYASKTTDIFFAGAAFQNRIRMLRAIAPVLAQYRTSILGTDWPEGIPGCRNQFIPNELLADHYAQSWVVLNIGRDLDLGNERFHLAPTTPGPRTFEAAMAGSVQLYHVTGLEIEDYFLPDSEILLFDHADEVPGIVESVLGNPDRAGAIAAAAQRRALQDHSYTSRAKQILEICFPGWQANQGKVVQQVTMFNTRNMIIPITGLSPMSPKLTGSDFVSTVAEELIRSIQPRRVLDAGCGLGTLVEAFWDRGIEAHGIDLSSYAISKVRPDIASYCRVASLTEPIEGHYDLVTCIEVLEHIPAAQAQLAVANICNATDTILFSSDPAITNEPTRVNMQPTIAWLRMFASQGFWPVVRFDASFVAPHAFLLRRGASADVSSDILELFTSLGRYKRTLATRTDEATQWASVATEATEQLAQLKTDNKVLENSQRATGTKLRELSLERDRLSEECGSQANAIQSQAGEILSLRSERDALGQQAQELNSQLAAAKHEADADASQLLEVTGQLNNQQVENQNLRNHCDALGQQAQDLNNQLAAAKYETHAAASQLLEVTAQLNSQQAENLKLRDERDTLSHQAEQPNSQLSAAKQQTHVTATRLLETTDRLNRQQAENQKLRNEYDALDQQLKSVCRGISAEVDQQTHRLREQLAETELRLKVTLDEQAELQRKSLLETNRLSNEVHRLESNCDSLRAKQERDAQEHNLKTERITTLRESLAQALDETKALRDRARQAEVQLRSIIESPAWRAVTAYRIWLKEQHDNRPKLLALYEKTLGRLLVGDRKQPAAPTAIAATPDLPLPAVAAATPVNEVALPEPSVQLPSDPVPLSSNDPNYQQWIEQNEPGPEGLGRQRTESLYLPYRPLISVVVPVYRCDPSFLRDCVASVLTQTYNNWELCLAHAGPYIEENLRYLRNVAAQDSRVKVVELETNLGISGNTNAGLQLATGDFVAFLDHDDTLAPFALFSVAKHLNEHGDRDLLYSDHDYLSAGESLRCNPLFKPGWSPDTMLSACYITHLTVCRRSLVEAVGGCDAATDGAQDWDLFLKIADRSYRVEHIPEVLYHWRIHAGSTALASSSDENAKPYAENAQLVAIKHHMERIGLPADPVVRPDGLLAARWLKPLANKISIIIPTKDKVDLVSKCIGSLLEKTRYSNFEVLLIDTGSQEPATYQYYETLKQYPNVSIHSFPPPFNWSAANNFGARKATGDLLLFLNNDIEILDDTWLEELAQWSVYGPIGIVGAKLLYPNGKLQHAGVVMGLGGFADHPFTGQDPVYFGLPGSTGWYRNWLAVTGACMMLRREVFDKIGGFDESFLLCGSDVEICLRAWQNGYRVLWTPFATLVHHERQSRGDQIPSADFFTSERCYGRYLDAGDPFWNRNLSKWSPQGDFRKAGETSSREFVDSYLRQLRPAPPATPASPPAASPGPIVIPAQGLDSSDNREPTEEENIVSWFDYSEDELSDLRRIWTSAANLRAVKQVVWFIPAFDVAFYGGIYTILSFADYWRRTKGVKSVFAVCGAATSAVMTERIGKVYHGCTKADVVVLARPADVVDLPESDACISTLWLTVFYALRYQRTSRHFYFIQDYEPAFYRAGSASAIVASTYRAGFYGIANTISLKKTYEEEYGGIATYFTPCVNTALFHPRGRKEIASKPWKVFVYARPQHARNSFELIAAAVRLLKQRLGDQVKIVTAGAEWKAEDYNLGGVVEHLGLLAYEETAELYRTCDIGVSLMFTRHPSYLPFEFMASGCLTVTNLNNWNTWFLQDNENCILARPTATCLADALENGLKDQALRKRITEFAADKIVREYSDWSKQMDHVYEFVCDPQKDHAETTPHVASTVA